MTVTSTPPRPAIAPPIDRRAPKVSPREVQHASDAAWPLVRQTPGYLSEREARFLMIAQACTPALGYTVEIGSFKGRSTVGLASIAKQFGLPPVVAVDPHTSPSDTDPDLNGANSSYYDFLSNLEAAGVREVVEPHRAFSYELANTWDRPIRFLWIDGDHTYEGAKTDLELFKPFLVPGAVVAMHDVLGTFEGSLRVFVEHILESNDFGPAGFSGSIGWAQYRPGEGRAFRHRFRRKLLAIPAGKLIPVAQAGRVATGINKYRYKFWRPLAPHGDVNPAKWAKRVRM